MITLSQLQESCPCFQIDDIAYLGDQKQDYLSLEQFGVWVAQQPWSQPILTNIPFGNIAELLKKPGYDRLVGTNCLQAMQMDYAKAMGNSATPAWMGFIPQKIRHLIHCSWLKVEADVYKIVPYTAHTGFGFVVLENGLVKAVDKAFDLHRLSRIHQLASLHSPVVSDSPVNEYPLKFTHTRYLHSLEVCAVATLIGNRCNISPQDMAMLRVAAQSHDALTAAGGDTIKPIDPGAFDEDAHYPELFLRPGWPRLREAYNLCPQKLTETILGKGLLGNILDIADKSAYTGTDVHQFLARNRPEQFAWEHFSEPYDRIQSLLNANPYPCSIWECAEEKNGELVFTDADRLGDFLRLRALMFNILYCNASSRFMEAGLVTEVARILYRDGTLTREALLEMTDDEFFNILNHSFGKEPIFCILFITTHGDPRVQTFETQEAAIDYEREIAKEQPWLMTAFEKGLGPSTKCLDTFKVLHKKEVLPLSQACPYMTWEIRRISMDPKPFRVYSYNLRAICPSEDMQTRLLDARNKRIAT